MNMAEQAAQRWSCSDLTCLSDVTRLVIRHCSRVLVEGENQWAQREMTIRRRSFDTCAS
jgi:hypothetical protein